MTVENNSRKNTRKILIGKVISTKMQKTITVLIERYVKHPMYHKRYKKTTKIHAHDEKSAAKLGDTVAIQETRPLSKTKAFRLLKIVTKNLQGEV